MRRRRGHHRPLGTHTIMRFVDWKGRRPPELGDVAAEVAEPGGEPDDIQRAYLIVGVEETRTGYRLVCERVAYGTAPEADDPDACWFFYKLPR